MPGSFIENDLDAVFDPLAFGEVLNTVIWQGVTIERCIFDTESIEVDLGDGHTSIIDQRRLIGKSIDFPGIADNDAIQIRGVTYTVKAWEDDGNGMIEIHLAKQ